MRRCCHVCVLAALFLLSGRLCGAAEQAFIRPDEVTAGMKGYGLTVFKGDRIERFDVEIIGVMTNFFPKADVVLARLSGPVVDRTGVIAGMSGSPVYIGDRLLGAVAYGWAFSKEPIAGIQPIVNMTPSVVIDRRERAEKAEAKGSLERFRRVAECLLASRYSGEPASDRAFYRSLREALGCPASPAPSASGLRLLPMPLFVNTADADPSDIEAMFPDMRVIPLAGSGGAGRGTPPELVQVPIRPGMAVGAALVMGDVDWTGMGTLTWADGDRIAAFGHPMLNGGEVALPMVAGDIVGVLPSQQQSFKFGSPRGLIGTVTQDRDTAIVGRVGQRPPMIPVHVAVGGAEGKDYNIFVAVDYRLTPMLLMTSVEHLSGFLQGSPRNVAFEGRVRIKPAGMDRVIEMQNMFAARQELLTRFLMLPAAAMMDNPFKRLDIERIDIEVKAVGRNRTAEIVNVFLDKYYAKAGEKVGATVTLRPWEGGTVVTRRLSFRIPDDAAAGSELMVLVCGGNESNMIDLAMRPGASNPRTIDQLLDLLGTIEPSTNLVLRISALKRGLSYNGETMPDLPPSMISVLFDNAQSGVVEPLLEDETHKVETSWIVTKDVRMKLRVVE